MKHKIYLLLTLFLMAILISGDVNATYNGNYVPGEILVKFKGGKTKSPAIEELNKKLGVISMKSIYPDVPGKSFSSSAGSSRIYKITLPESTNILKTVKIYSSMEDIEYAQANYILYGSNIKPNDPKYSEQESYLTTMKASEAWSLETGKPGIIIAIIDSGVDWNQPDLKDNMWVNTGDSWGNPDLWSPDADGNNGNGKDDDNNGFIDDYRGWSFINTSASNVYTGEDFGPPNGNSDDFAGHGTFVSGQAAAVGNNEIGVTGIAWNCKIMSLKAGYLPKNGTTASFSTDSVTGAISYAVDNGARVINMSFGGRATPEDYPIITEAVKTALNKGVVVVAAAGNSGIEGSDFPGNIPGVISVGSVDTDGNKSYFSNYGTNVDVYATGNKVFGTFPEGNYSKTGAVPYTTQVAKKNTYDSWSGTSFSTSVVSGIAGLILSRNASLTQEQVVSQIINYSEETSSGINITNIYNSLKEGQINTATVNYTLLQGWNLISFPMKTVESLTGFTGSFYYDEGGQTIEISQSDLTKLEAGKSYWTYTGSNATASAKGTILSENSFTKTLPGKGIKGIGNPFTLPVYWGNGNVMTGTGKNLEDAENQGLVTSSIYYYNTSSGNFVPLSYNSGNMESGRGYFISGSGIDIIIKK